MSLYQLTTERTILIPVAIENASELHHLWTQPEVRKFLWDDVIIPESQTKEIIQVSQQQFLSEQSGLWLVRDLRHRGLLGFWGLWYLFDESQPQLLFGLDPKYFEKVMQLKQLLV